ncbi:hypothetical protein Tco_0003223 [Tanacetum coccineum]
MANLEFIDQHNMVACLEKTGGNSEFHEIVDFLTSSLIHHALTQIHATVDRKAVVVTKASIGSYLLLHDADGTACLTNEAIFQNLALMGYEGELNKLTFQKALFSPQWKYLIHTILHCLSSKSTSWNEFSTNIASAVICLATNQKFNFSKLIFDGMLRNLDTSKKKFLMYPRFLMVFLNNQIELGEPFNDVYVTPAHTQKVFSNMSRKGVKFSGKVTPLFDSMLVPHQAPEGEGSEQPTEPQPTPSPTHPSTGDQPPVTDSSSSHDTTQDSRDSLEDTNGSEGTQVQSSHDSPLSGDHTSEKAEGGLNLEELFVLCTNLSNRVLALETSKDAQAAEILKLKDQIKKLKRKCKPSISHHRAWLKSVKRLSMKKRDYTETEDVVKKGRQSNETKELNKGSAKIQQEEREEYTSEERTKFLAETIAAQRKFRAAQRSTKIRNRPPTKSQLRNLMMTYMKNMGGYKHSQLKAKTFIEIQGLYERYKRLIDYFKPMDSDDAVKDSKEAAGVHKQKVLEEPNSTKVEVKQEGHEESIRKRPGRRLKMKATKKHGAKCIYYRIFRSDGSSRWIKTFSKMVTRFDRLDLVELYNLVMKRFETTTPEDADLVLWGDLRTMFDANAEYELWQNQER